MVKKTLTALFLCCALALAAFASTHEALPLQFSRSPEILANWGSDTPQPDTIAYDDPAAGTFYAWGGVCYVSVRFTPALPFDLHAAYVGIQVLSSSALYNVWVTGDNAGYADPGQILEIVSNLTPLSGWNQVDFALVHHFDADQDFHIVCGPFQATLQYGPGTYPLLDSSPNWLHRSYVSEDWPLTPPTEEFGGYDWRLQAGGEYSSGQWLDLACSNVDNTLLRYFLCPSELVFFRTLVRNLGTQDATSFGVTWTVTDEGGLVTFSTGGVYGPLPTGDSLMVTAPLPWSASDLGEFVVTSTVTILGDILPENNIKVLEQYVYEPSLPYLMHYDIPDFQANLSLNPGMGIAMEFTPCDYPVTISQIQVQIASAPGIATLRIYGDDGLDDPDPDNILFDITLPLTVGNNLIPVGGISITSGSFYVAYEYLDPSTPSIPLDNEPSAGTNETMGVVYQRDNPSAGYVRYSHGDHPLRAMITPPEVENCSPAQIVTPDIFFGVQVDYYADGTMIPFCYGSGHPPGSNYPASAVHLAVANNYQDCYLVYVNACLDINENHIPGHTGQVSRVVPLTFHPGYSLGLAYDRRDDTFWCGDWETNTLYNFADITGPGGIRIAELYGTFPASYFGLMQMPISGLEIDQDSHSLWAVLNGNPDQWLKIDITNPAAPLLMQGPFPILWQSGGGPFSAAGLEYCELLNQLVAINQNTNSVEEFLDVGVGIPVALSSCNLFYNGQSFGSAVLEGPATLINDSTYASGHIFTIDNQWQGVGPFLMREGDPPEPAAALAKTFHCESVYTGAPGYVRRKINEPPHSNYQSYEKCKNYPTCDTVYVRNGAGTFKCNCCGEVFVARGSSLGWEGGEKRYHIGNTGVVPIGRSTLLAVQYVQVIDGVLECYASNMTSYNRTGAFGSFAEGYTIAQPIGAAYNRFQAIQETPTGVTRFSNHPLSVGPLTAQSLPGPSVQYSVPPGEVIAFDAAGSVSYPPLAIYLPSHDYLAAPGFPGDTIAVDFEIINAGSVPATISLIPHSSLGWLIVACPASITLGAGAYGTVAVLVQVPPSVPDYTSDFLGLQAALAPDTVGMGVVIKSIPPLDVTIAAVGSDVQLQWRSANDPLEIGTSLLSYRIWRTADPTAAFSPIATVSDTTWTDYGVLLGNTKFFYRVTAGFFE